jgi:hypothetical protein
MKSHGRIALPDGTAKNVELLCSKIGFAVGGGAGDGAHAAQLRANDFDEIAASSDRFIQSSRDKRVALF